jgi:hypothetical protein
VIRAPAAPRPRTRRGRGLVALLVVMAATSTAGCGIPTDHSARPLDPHALPAALAQSTTTSTAKPGSQQVQAPIFVLQTTGQTQRLKAIRVPVPYSSNQSQQARLLIASLIAYRPPASGSTTTLTNPIPSSVRIKSAKIQGGILDLDVSNLENIENSQQRVAFAQIVYTATSLTGIGILRVRFSIDEHPIQVQLRDGLSKSGQPVGPDDFRDLRPAA